MILSSIKYDFESSSYIVELEDASVSGSGTTIEEAVESLRYQANKHNLWPKDKNEQS